ncbi:hypothetical protein HY945_00430 [Candidatus Gottesmanbacteria bacterium]|nr:hypothetical protein [Candidatus Gottesmanbacteria bacterium]
MFEIFMIISGVVARLLPHLPNFTPIAATALFGGVYMKKRYAIIIPLVAMFVSDIFIGFHAMMPYVYGSFILTGLIGMYLHTHKNVQNVAAAALISSILFFLITNFGVWAGGMYARNLSGLLESYVMAIPFFRNTLLGDLFYTGAFFGAYELVKMIVYNLRVKTTV